MATLQRVFQKTVHSVHSKQFGLSLSKYISTSCFSVLNQKPKEKESFFQKLWDTADTSAYTNAHSKTLTDAAVTYKLVFDNVKPECISEYIDATSKIQTKLNDSKDYPGSLVGSWTSIYGDLDQSVHIWMYEDGYTGMSKQQEFFMQDKDVIEYNREKGKWLNSRKNQICHHFGYWGQPEPRKPSHIYEMRSYSLKPGTLIQWSNRWGQAISIRRKDAVGGFFSQIGDLYEVHHIWAYNDLAHRRDVREKMWQQPGWDDCVASTVPLVREMKCLILSPNRHSPMQ